MKRSEIIKYARLQKNLSENDVAKNSDMSIYEYGDVESSEDELETSVTLARVKKLCEYLNLDIFELFSIENIPKNTAKKRNEIIKERRIEKKLTPVQLGDAIGFYSYIIDDMEKDPSFMEDWWIVCIKELAQVLEIPVSHLLFE